jgi:hypothetical protein
MHVRLLTPAEKATIQRIVDAEDRTTANVCTMLIRERLFERAAPRRTKTKL